MADRASTTSIDNLSTRARLADAIEAAIAALDLLDDDPDLEPMLAGYPTPGALDDGEPDEDDEASLGWLNSGSQLHLRADYRDGEAEDDGTAEPSLGSSERQPSDWGPYGFNVDHRSSQTNWASGSSSDDREHDAGDEGEEENEHGCDLGGSDNGIGDQLGLDSDREPSLGALSWATGTGSQERWAWGGTSDLEPDAGDEGEAADEDCDGEFSGGTVLIAKEPSWAEP